MSAQLTVEYTTSTPKESLFGFALRITVTNAVNMPAEIFIFQRGAAAAPAAGETVKDNFISLADPVDLEEIPVNAPDILNEIPYYRLATVTLLFRSLIDLESTKVSIQDDIRTLIQTMNATSFDGNATTETVTYPEA